MQNIFIRFFQPLFSQSTQKIHSSPKTFYDRHMRTYTHKYNLYTLCIHIIIGYAEYGIPIQHQTTIHFLKQRSNSAQQKIDLFYGVYLSKHFPACESLEIASTFFSLATLKFSLLLTQTQGKDFGSYILRL